MTKTDIYEQVRVIITDKMDGVQPEEVKPEADFRSDLGGDSLDLTEVLMEVDKKFSIDTTDEEAERIRTVKDITDLVERKL